MWRCALGFGGTLSVTQALMIEMQVWLAGNLASPDTVSIYSDIFTCESCTKYHNSSCVWTYVMCILFPYKSISHSVACGPEIIPE